LVLYSARYRPVGPAILREELGLSACWLFPQQAMRDIDPWRAEPFRPGKNTKETAVYTASGQNHRANIATPEEEDRAAATRMVMKFAGLDVDTPAKSPSG